MSSSTIMALIDLPPELLEPIIIHTLPEGFESLALSCKGIYALCRPFLERHNQLCSLFRNFNYCDKIGQPPFPIRTAFDLIARIAVEPVVARYIRNADFQVDSFFLCGRPHDLWPDGEDVARLLANSPFLAHAGLNWKEYYAEIEKDISNPVREGRGPLYSQRAAAFLLTLMPNVKTLRLPRRWKPIGVTDKLIDTIVYQAKKPCLPWCTPSLAQVIKFGPSIPRVGPEIFLLNWASPFLALPQIQSFHGPACIATSDVRTDTASKYLHVGFGETLEVVDLRGSCIDEIAIADFLKHTPRLRTLRYSCSTIEDGPQDWDICQFVTAIEREVGHQLEELFISINKLRGLILPGKTSMRGFQRLRKLEFPLEIAMCVIDATESRVANSNEPPLVENLADLEKSHCIPWIGDLVPASVSQLSLLSCGTDHHKKALSVMFHNFAARREAQLPALAEIHVSCPTMTAGSAYKYQCQKLSAEIEKAGINLHLEEWPKCFQL